jgi:hypothetical protein
MGRTALADACSSSETGARSEATLAPARVAKQAPRPCYADEAHTSNDIGTLAKAIPHALLTAAVVPHAGWG